MGVKILLARMNRKYRKFLKHGFKVCVDNQTTIMARLIKKIPLSSGGKVLFFKTCDSPKTRYVYLFADTALYNSITAEDTYMISYCECLIMSYQMIGSGTERIVCYPKDGSKDNTAYRMPCDYDQKMAEYRQLKEEIKASKGDKKSFIDRCRQHNSRMREIEYHTMLKHQIDMETTVEVWNPHTHSSSDDENEDHE